MSEIVLKLEQLAIGIRAAVAASDKEEAAASEHVRLSEESAKAAGDLLIKARDLIGREKGKRKEWTAFVKNQCGLCKSRADELVSIAEGRTTLSATNERAAKGMAKTRAKRKAAPADRNPDDVTADARPKRSRFYVTGSACNAHEAPTPLQFALEAFDRLSDDDCEQFLASRGLQRMVDSLVPANLVPA